MLVEGFSQLLRDHSQTINYLKLLLFVLLFILHLLVKNCYEIVHILHEINNKKTYLTPFFPVKAVTFALKMETQKQCERNYLFEN